MQRVWHTMLSHKTGAKTWSEALVHSKSTKHWSRSLNFKYGVMSLILLNRKQTNTDSETDPSHVKKKKKKKKALLSQTPVY